MLFVLQHLDGHLLMDNKLRAKVLERDRFRCRGCTTGSGELHHIVFRSHGGQDTEDNLITLCRGCHDQAHGKKRAKLPAWVLQAMLTYNKWRACCGLWKEFARTKNCLTCDARTVDGRCLFKDIEIGPLDGCDDWALRSFDVHT